jgi:hypothetical protein
MTWISCKIKLPEAIFGAENGEPFLSEDVVVFFESGGFAISNYDHETKVWTEAKDSAKEFDCDPIYWMSLPEVPVLQP